MTTVWTIPTMDRQADTGLVTTVHYVATKTDGDAVGSVYASMAVEAGDTVIPFAELTEEIVIGWLSDKLDLTSVEAALDAQISAQKTPVVLSGVPW